MKASEGTHLLVPSHHKPGQRTQKQQHLFSMPSGYETVAHTKQHHATKHGSHRTARPHLCVCSAAL
jgi:hypothetical protein